MKKSLTNSRKKILSEGNDGDKIVTLPSSNPSQTIDYRKSTDFHSYYSNNFRISISSNDVTLICGTVEAQDSVNPAVEEQFLVRLSPLALKGLIPALQGAIDGWQKLFGVLPELRVGIVNNAGMADIVAKIEKHLNELPKN